MNDKINTYAELVARYPGIDNLPLSVALLYAYRLGRLDGEIAQLNREAIARDKRDFSAFSDLAGEA